MEVFSEIYLRPLFWFIGTTFLVPMDHKPGSLIYVDTYL